LPLAGAGSALFLFIFHFAIIKHANKHRLPIPKRAHNTAWQAQLRANGQAAVRIARKTLQFSAPLGQIIQLRSMVFVISIMPNVSSFSIWKAEAGPGLD